MNEDPQSFVTEINGCISTAAKRQHGLLKLALFLETCQTKEHCSLLEKNTAFWIKTILQIFENHPISIHAKLAQYCFYLLVQNSRNVSPELSRMISTNFIDKSISLLIVSNEQLSKNSLACLNELMSTYRGACSQYRQKIETHVLNKLDSGSDEVIEWASKCYSKLPYLHKNQGNTDMWYAYFKNALKNANLILNDLFEEYQPSVSTETDVHDNSLNNDNNKPTGSSSLILNKSETLFYKLNKENLEFYVNKSLKRFKACCLALGYLFEPLNEKVIVKVKFNEIISLLRRVLFFDLKKLINNSRVNMEAKYLNEIISDLFNCVLKFTAKFISVANTNLIPNSNLINHMLSNFGLNLNEKTLFNSVTVYYDCLNGWIQTIGGNSGFHIYSSSLIDVLLSNITPHKANILSIENNKNNSKNIVQTQANQIEKDLFYNDKSILNNFQSEIRSKSIISALNCLRSFIKNFSYKLNYNHFEKIQQTLIGIILSIQHNYSTQKPYDQYKCRIELYRNLYELCLTKNSKLAPPLSISISLFRNALDDCSNEIKSFAQDSLNNLRAFTCPILPVYIKEFKISVPQQEDQHVEMDQDQSLRSIVNLTSNTNNKLSVQMATNNFSFSNNQFNKIENKKMLAAMSIRNNSNSENSSNSVSESINANSNSFISNNTNSQLSETNSKLATNQSTLSEMKNSLSLATNQTNGLKRKLINREDSLGDDSFHNVNGAKVYLADKKSVSMSKNFKVNREDSNGNDEEHEEDEEDEDEEDEIDEEDEDEEEDEDDMSNEEEEEQQISGVKKLETSDEIIRIDSDDEDEDDTNPDDNEFEDEDFENEEELENGHFDNGSCEASEDKPESNKIIKQNDNHKIQNSKSSCNKKTDNDIENKAIVSKLLDAYDYEDDEGEETGENSTSREISVKNDTENAITPENPNEDTKVIENKENLVNENCTDKTTDDLNFSKKTPSKQPEKFDTHKELNNQSLNILKSPITRGDTNEITEKSVILNGNDYSIKSPGINIENEQKLNSAENPQYSTQIEAILHQPEKINQEGNKFVNLETCITVPSPPESIMAKQEQEIDDLKIKEMCETFNPDALALNNVANNQEEDNKIE